mgnify:CR=1 FL=1
MGVIYKTTNLINNKIYILVKEYSIRTSSSKINIMEVVNY